MSDGMKIWQVWCEGYVTSGERSNAQLLGTYEAPSFDEAVKAWEKETQPGIDLRVGENGVWIFWGCRLFDNEADARKAFG